MTVEKVIELCGGEREVMYRLEFTNLNSVRRWKDYGIPQRHWGALIVLAKENKHSLTGSQLWEANRPLVKS